MPNKAMPITIRAQLINTTSASRGNTSPKPISATDVNRAACVIGRWGEGTHQCCSDTRRESNSRLLFLTGRTKSHPLCRQKIERIAECPRRVQDAHETANDHQIYDERDDSTEQHASLFAMFCIHVMMMFMMMLVMIMMIVFGVLQ